MHAKTMEGLVGASTNMQLLNTPFRVFKEARLRGDRDTMERAMGYVTDYSDKAGEYMAEAEKGMKEDAKEAREKAEAQREDAVEKRREEREELEKKIEDSKTENSKTEKTDSVEISEDGKAVWSENAGLEQKAQDGSTPVVITEDTVKTKPVIYTKTGEVSPGQPESSVNISVSV